MDNTSNDIRVITETSAVLWGMKDNIYRLNVIVIVTERVYCFSLAK